MGGAGFVRLFTLLAFLTISLNPLGAAREFNKSEVISLWLFKFANFYTWPDHAFDNQTAPLKIGVYGDKEVVSLVRVLIANAGDEKPRRIEIDLLSSPSDAANQHMIYFAEDTNRIFQQVRDRIRSRPVLTVGYIPGFIDNQGQIGLVYLAEKKVFRYELNLKATREGGLVVNPHFANFGLRVIQ